MAYDYSENAKRLDGMSQDMKDVAAKALADGHPILREAGFHDLSPDALNADKAQLESMGAVAAEMEAIVLMTNRPPLMVKNGKVVTANIPLPDFGPTVYDKIRAVEPMIASVGRIEFVNHDMDWGGTGWVIAEDGPGHLLVATNRHVAKLVARRTAFGTGTFLFDPGGGGRYGALIDFNEEHETAAEHARNAQILGFTYLAEDSAADVAIARIKVPTGFRVEPLTLADADGSDAEPVAIVGYPARDSRNDTTHMERYFRGLYNVKRFSPGLLRVQPGATRLTHDATTLGGNSGSPVISLDSARVVGLHFAGKYSVGNSAVRVSTLKAILSGGKTVVTGADLNSEDVEGRDGKREPSDLSGRPGYDPAFLEDFTVPMPDVSGVPNIALVTPSDAECDRPHELRYQHFGILYCGTYRSPVVAAANLDGKRAKKIKRDRDRWFFDLRIDQKLQVGSEAYSDAGVDRGHMVRREDPNWGDDEATVRRANYDTFHLTNCSPQHGKFNRNIATWQGLENYLLENTRTLGFRASVFTGPVLAEDLDMIEEFDLFLPREYWKVVVMPVAGEDGATRPHATAYLLSQGHLIQKLMQERGDNEAVEGFAFGEYKTFQVPIATLEAATGIDFGSLRDFDPLAMSDNEATATEYIILHALDEARL